MSSDALSIYQDWLDTMYPAILGGDMDVIARHVSLPYLHRSQDRRLVIETRKDMETGFTSFMQMLRGLKVDKVIGLATVAEYLSDDYIEGQHVVHALRNTVAALPLHTNRAVLRRGTTNWKLSEIEFGFSHGDWPIQVIHVAERSPAHRSVKDDVRRESTQPLALYQRFLNALTRANVTGDFGAYCRLLDFPYSFHSIGRDMIAEGPEEVRPHFDMVTGLLRENRIEEFARIADHAEFLSSNMICGYHSTRMMRGGTDALEPIRSRMILHRHGTRWFLKSVTNAVKDDTFPYGQPVVASDLVTEIEIQKRTKT